MRVAYKNKNNIKKNMLINKNIEELTFDLIVSKIKTLI
jgi:hypothetical protein